MRIAEILQSMANWLESPSNEALLLSEYNEECMKIVAENLILAAALIKNAAEQVDELEPIAESNITSETIEGLAEIATAFDSSGNAELKKQASLIDELLLTVAANPDLMGVRKDLQDARIEELKKKYHGVGKELDEMENTAQTIKDIDKSKMTEAKINQHPLSTRYCPDHFCQVARVGEHQWQCPLDHKIYNYDTGFDLNDGNLGGSIELQTPSYHNETVAVFDDRVGRLESNKV